MLIFSGCGGGGEFERRSVCKLPWCPVWAILAGFERQNVRGFQTLLNPIKSPFFQGFIRHLPGSSGGFRLLQYQVSPNTKCSGTLRVAVRDTSRCSNSFCLFDQIVVGGSQPKADKELQTILVKADFRQGLQTRLMFWGRAPAH